MEVLIAMVVIAVGLLGFMALQLASINSSQEGMARSQANLLGQDLSNLMRANRSYINDDAGAAGSGNNYLSSVNDYNSCTAAKPFDCTSGTCTQEEQAQFDVWQVCSSLKGFNYTDSNDDLLIDGKIYVDCEDIGGVTDSDACSPGSLMTIYVLWRESEGREDVGQKKVAMNSRCLAEANSQSLADVANYQCILLDLIP